MKIAVRATELFVRNLTLRVPFRYGIATMTRVPHLVVRVTAEIGGKVQRGFTADNLPPKWFTKNPATSFAQEIAEMVEVTEHAGAAAQQMPASASVFAWWLEVTRLQDSWAAARGFPPLLAGFGVSLVERAVIDAFCRATGCTFAAAVRENTFDVQLAAIHPEVAGRAPAEFLPSATPRSIIVRHTVGLTDPLTDSEIAPAEAMHDGLPHSLESFIRAQGLTHFKIKLGGEIERDRTRLQQIAGVVASAARSCAFTLDGNENFRTVAPFRALWEQLRADPLIARFLAGLIFVEQPFHRDVALHATTAAALLAWTDRPPIIIDESDAEFDSLRIALAGGYAGTSHKNCKGVFRGLANACLIAQRREIEPGRALHISAEDLTNLGPVALPQDLAAVAVLGITHAERNGHHYFAGLSQFPVTIQEAVMRHHGDLFTASAAGYPTVEVRDGILAIGSVIDAPFGTAFEPDLSDFTAIADWRFESL